MLCVGATRAESQCVSAEFAISDSTAHTSPRRANATTTIRREYYVGTERLEEEVWGSTVGQRWDKGYERGIVIQLISVKL